MNFIKIFSALVIALFVFIVVDACKPAKEWLGSVYVNGQFVGVCEVIPNGRCVKGEVLRDTVVHNGVTQYETIVLVSPIR